MQKPPTNYICFKCKVIGDHWIFDCASTIHEVTKQTSIQPQYSSLQSLNEITPINNKSSKWNELRFNYYHSIYTAIKCSDFCSKKIYQASIGIIPDIIIKQIALLTVDSCTALLCNNCNNEIDSYPFETANKSNDSYIYNSYSYNLISNNANIPDYYLSDDDASDKIFCSTCCSNCLMMCEYRECNKLDKKTVAMKCGHCICSRHNLKEYCRNPKCEERKCPECEVNCCHSCSVGICYACKSCCNGCDGTDSCHDCWLHEDCVMNQPKCGICDGHCCMEVWGHDGISCSLCDMFICVTCADTVASGNYESLLCNQCKQK
eukprot:197339_1